MKTFRYLGFLLCSSLLLQSCQQDMSGYTPTTTPTTTSDFDFSTSKSVALSVDYGMNVAVPFSVYAENPIVTETNEDGSTSTSLNSDIQPLFTGYTSSDGTYTGTITLASYTSTLYIVSSAYFVTNVLEATISDGAASVNDDNSVFKVKGNTNITRSGTEGTYIQTMAGTRTDFSKSWTCPLGTFDSYSGAVTYGAVKDADNENLFFTDTQVNNFYSAVTAILNVNKECPAEYLASQDLVVPKDETVSLTAMGGNTCWNSSLGYYYYTGDAPTSISNLTVFAVYPNTQDGKWTVGSSNPVGVTRGTNIILKYYGTDYKSEASNIFPKGTKIGFVLAGNAWPNNASSGRNKNVNFNSFTTPGLSTDNYYSTGGTSKTSWTAEKRALYTNINTALMNYQDGTIVAFEDYNDDHNCTDVQFALKPQFGVNDEDNQIKDLVTTDTNYTASDVYAFEDMWPSEGDYDMNDVLVYTTYGKVTEMDVTQSSNYYTTAEEFLFQTDQNHSKRTELDNGMAAWINGTGLSIAVSVKASDAEKYTTLESSKYTVTEESGKTYIYLDSNVKNDMGSTYKVTVSYDYSAKKSAGLQTTYGCFLYRDDAKGRWEMHIPYEEPTSQLCDYYKAYLVTDKPYAATTSDNDTYFPFAIKLTSAAQSKLTKLTDSDNETKRIDALYTNYSNWMKSKGESYTDWYNE